MIIDIYIDYVNPMVLKRYLLIKHKTSAVLFFQEMFPVLNDKKNRKEEA